MEFFIKEIFQKRNGENGHRHFVRFGKGNYRRKFVISMTKGNKIKIRASFEFANDFVRFAKECKEKKDLKFSGKILTKEKVSGVNGKKKAGSYVYEISESSIEEYEDAYFYLLDVNSGDLVLKIKKSLPKPGKNADKIDDKFCSLDLDLKYWGKIKEVFFWDVPENAKKAKIEHELVIKDIILPEGTKDPMEMREFAKRKGKIIRKLIIDSKEEVKEADFMV